MKKIIVGLALGAIALTGCGSAAHSTSGSGQTSATDTSSSEAPVLSENPDGYLTWIKDWAPTVTFKNKALESTLMGGLVRRNGPSSDTGYYPTRPETVEEADQSRLNFGRMNICQQVARGTTITQLVEQQDANIGDTDPAHLDLDTETVAFLCPQFKEPLDAMHACTKDNINSGTSLCTAADMMALRLYRPRPIGN
jgi:hypothetical protein